MFKYTRIYFARIPKLKEDDIFRTFIPLRNKKGSHDIGEIYEESDRENKINASNT